MTDLERFELAYKFQRTPWDIGRPDQNLIDVVKNRPINPGKTLELGCGKGYDAFWLYRQGFEVDAIDFSSIAIRSAHLLLAQNETLVNFIEADIFEYEFPTNEYDFIYDRSCMTSVFANAELIIPKIHTALKTDGLWLSFLKEFPVGTETPQITSEMFTTKFSTHFDIIAIDTFKFNSKDFNLTSSLDGFKILMQKKEII